MMNVPFISLVIVSFALIGCADLTRAKQDAAVGDYPSAVAQWKKLSKYNIPEAQLRLGLAYLKGQGVARDSEKGIGLLARAAGSNDPKVLFEIGRVYATGVPGAIKPDYKKAWDYLTRAYGLGQTRALVIMADMTEKGQGVPRDPKKANDIMKTASDLGVGTATHRLGRAALKAGKTGEAITLLDRAIEQGTENAGLTLAELYVNAGKIDRARDAYTRALAAGAVPTPKLAAYFTK